MKALMMIGFVILVGALCFFPEKFVALIPADENGDVTRPIMAFVLGAPLALVIIHSCFVRNNKS